MDHTKVCTKCQEEYPATTEYFHSSPRNKHGVTTSCKKCRSEDGKKRYHNETPEQRRHRKKRCQKWEQENKEKRKEQRRRHDRSDYFKEYYSNEENRQRRNEYCKQHRLDNLDHYKELMSKHFQDNKSSYYARAAKRRGMQRNQAPDYTNHELIARIYDACPEGYEVDHMKPITKGGLHHESNLCYLPSKINKSKAAKTIEEFGEDVFNQHVIYWQVLLLEE